MLKKLLFTTALSGLMLSSAMAQYSPPSSSSTTPPAASSDSMKSDTSKSSDAMKADSSKTNSSASASAISAQQPDQLLASKFKGTDVIGSDDKKIGDVSDILFSKDGKVEAYIISVGGFLGVGAKDVALAPSSVQLIQDKDEHKLKVTMTKDQLAQAPNFEVYKEKHTTTGAASNNMGANAPRNTAPKGGMAPTNATPPANTTPPANPPK